jgi:FdhD protein
MIKEMRVKRYKGGEVEAFTDFIVQEKEVELIINGIERLTVSMSPEDLRPFAHGFLLTSGLISDPAEIESVDITDNRILIELKQMPGDFRLVLSSGCGSGTTMDAEIAKRANKEVLLPDLELLPGLFKTFAKGSPVFDQTGGIHSAAITDGKKIIYFSEDIGRHNAVDKVIGKGILNHIDMSRHFILSSGRISGEIVKKAFYSGLRAIVSRSAPTCAAVKRARRVNIGIIGFLRGQRFNIYN